MSESSGSRQHVHAHPGGLFILAGEMARIQVIDPSGLTVEVEVHVTPRGARLVPLAGGFSSTVLDASGGHSPKVTRLSIEMQPLTADQVAADEAAWP